MMGPDVFGGEDDQADQNEEDSLEDGQKQADDTQKDKTPAHNQNRNLFNQRLLSAF